MAVHANSTGAPVVVRLPTAATKKVKQPENAGELIIRLGIAGVGETIAKRAKLKREELRPEPTTAQVIALAMGALITGPHTKRTAKSCRKRVGYGVERLIAEPVAGRASINVLRRAAKLVVGAEYSACPR